ncbi:hypothetical protein YC2023_044619 [Brassica napus]
MIKLTAKNHCASDTPLLLICPSLFVSPLVLFLSSLLKMQEDSSLLDPPQNRFSDTLRQAMRTRINVILQRRLTRFDTTRLPEYINSLESKLMNSANSEHAWFLLQEEYSNSRDLEVRIHYLRKQVRESCSHLSHGISSLPDSLITQILMPSYQRLRRVQCLSLWNQ